MDTVDPCNTMTEYEKLAIFKEPCCLVENSPDGKLKTCGKVLDEIKLIGCPLDVITMTGNYRTGKSYLLNYLAGTRTGFPLGSSIRSKTKGIWVWCRPHPEKQNKVLILLDTEGFGDIKKGNEENDVWIFSLCVLLSSTLVYNSLSTIDQHALSQLHYVTELTKRIKTRDTSKNEDGGEFFSFFPNFVWVLRDFTLKLEDEEGKPITSDQYLMDALQLKDGNSSKIDDYNRPRRCIREFFQDKKCFVFCPPLNNWKDMEELERLPDSQLEPMFLHEAEKFCSYIYTRSFPKTAKDQPVQGRMFCSLLETYLESIQSGNILCLENAVKNMAERENASAVKASFDVYESQMKEILQKPSKTEEELIQAHLDCSFKAIQCFMSMSQLDEEGKYQCQLKEKIGQKNKEIYSEWKRDHAGSESANGEEDKQMLATFKELYQDISELQKRLILEKENMIKEIERRRQQREEEIKATTEFLHLQPGKNDEALKTLRDQLEQIERDRKRTEDDLNAIKEGDSSFGKYLLRGGRAVNEMIQGSLVGYRLGSLAGNSVVAAVSGVIGGLWGGISGFWG